jgi:hypothetical protein
MNRQLRASGGIMDVTPRENFGLGSSLKKFVRKIIPNEVADIAVKAAPFVAPFNPALAAGMSGLGTFDQTGSISAGLKSGAMNYGGGQLARYAGGADFQGNPFGKGGAFRGGLEGFKSGFSSPLGNQTGFKLGKPVQEIQGVNEGSYLPFQGEEMNIPNYSEQLLEIQGGSPNQMTITESIQKILSPNTTMTEKGGEALNLLKRGTKAAFTKPGPDGKPMLDKAAVMGAVAFAGSYAEALALADDAGVELTEEAYDEARKAEKQEEYAGYLTNFFGGKRDGGRIGYEGGANELIEEKIAELEFLTNKLMTEEGIQDRGYASKLASDIIGMKNENIDPNKLKFLNNESALFALPRDIRPEDEYYDTLKALENRADGGRIGYEGGANELIMEKLTEDIMQDTSTEDMIMIMTDDGPKMIKRSHYEAMPGMFRDTTTSLYGDAARGRPVPEFANGGRIGYARGTPDNTTMFEELNTDTIYRPEPESTITLPEEMPGDDKMAGSQGYDEQYNSFIQLRDQFQYQEGDSYSEANRKAKQIVYGMKDGGRINRRLGSPEEGEGSGLMEMLSVEVDAGGDEEEENMMMAYEPGSFKKDKFKPMEIDAINERLQTFLDMEGGGLPLPLVGTVKGIANTLKAGKAVFTGPEKTTIIRNLAGRSRGTNAYKELGKSIPEAKRIMDNPIDYLKDAAIFKELLKGIFKKDGGRIGYKDGTGSSNRVAQLMLERDYLLSKDEDVSFIDLELERDFGIQMKAEGGIMEAKVPTGQMRKNNAGVAERDYRQTGGFVPVGIKERADDVPAMLSKNEFVMTADAVRGLGNGSVEEGSKKLYNTMKQAEKVGKA